MLQHGEMILNIVCQLAEISSEKVGFESSFEHLHRLWFSQVFREVVPELGSNRAESAVPHSDLFSPVALKEVGL